MFLNNIVFCYVNTMDHYINLIPLDHQTVFNVISASHVFNYLTKSSVMYELPWSISVCVEMYKLFTSIDILMTTFVSSPSLWQSHTCINISIVMHNSYYIHTDTFDNCSLNCYVKHLVQWTSVNWDLNPLVTTYISKAVK